MMLLAPVVKERKGEHVKLLQQIAAQGYIRARIDGEICDLSDPPKLELQKNIPSKWWWIALKCGRI